MTTKDPRDAAVLSVVESITAIEQQKEAMRLRSYVDQQNGLPVADLTGIFKSLDDEAARLVKSLEPQPETTEEG